MSDGVMLALVGLPVFEVSLVVFNAIIRRLLASAREGTGVIVVKGLLQAFALILALLLAFGVMLLLGLNPGV